MKQRKAVVKGTGSGTVIEEACGLLLIEFHSTKFGPRTAWVDPRKEVITYA